MNFNFKSNTIIEEYNFQVDYLDPQNFKLHLLKDTEIALTDWVNIRAEARNFCGIVTNIQDSNTGVLIVTLKDAMSLLDVDLWWNLDVLYDYGTLERTVAIMINSLYGAGTSPVKVQVLNADINIVTREVSTFFFDIEAEDPEVSNFAVFNFYDTILLPALKNYDVVVDMSINLATKRLQIDVLHRTTDKRTIEADLENVIEKEVVVNKSRDRVTKAIIVNSDNYSVCRLYYLHPDGTFDAIDRDRVYPTVIKYDYAAETTKKEEDETETVIPFGDNAKEKARGIFEATKYENYITLKVMADDWLVNPLGWSIGDKASIISNGIIYESIFTGFEYDGEVVKMIFGLMRLELTKILKGRA